MDDPLFAAAIELLKRSTEAVQAATPKRDRELPNLEALPVRMTWRLVARCEAINNLLADGLLDEATILLRTLMWDCHRLLYMDKHPDRREALILRLEQDRLTNLENLTRLAEERGRDVKELRKDIEKRRRDVQRVSLPYGRLKPFPQDGDSLARSLDREGDIVNHKMFSHAAHSAAWSQVANFQKTEDGHFHLNLRNKSPRLVAAVANHAAEYLFLGTIATARAQEWQTLDELREKYREVEIEFEALAAQRAEGGPQGK